jgi:FkbH-like protein
MREAFQCKVVIWDLDDTLWKGTLSEGKVELNSGRADLVKRLATCGVLNSICSKNDPDQAREKLTEFGLWDFFVFPSIQWGPKGPAVKNLLNLIKLRAENTIFVDDNELNSREVLHYNPGITTLHPSELDRFGFSTLKEKDPALKRLHNYKHLEEKEASKQLFIGSNEDFLRQSDIKITIGPLSSEDPETERVLDLINRTNQLNFTKVRYPAGYASLIQYLTKGSLKNIKIYASDKFGNYGLIGFVSLDESLTVRHFLFSCRVLDLGIEKVVYKYVKNKFPKVNFPFPTTPLEKDIDWITVEERLNYSEPSRIKKSNFLFPGLCEAEAIQSFLDQDFEVIRAYPLLISTFRKFKEKKRLRSLIKFFWTRVVLKYVNNLEAEDFQKSIDSMNKFLEGSMDYFLYPTLYDAYRSILKISGLPSIPFPTYFHWKYLDQMPEYAKYLQEGFNQLHPIHGSAVKRNWKLFLNKKVFNYIIRRIFPRSPEAIKSDLQWLLSKMKNGTKIIIINLADHGHYLDFNSDFINPIIHARIVALNNMFDEIVRENREKVLLADLRGKIKKEDVGDVDGHYNRRAFFTIARTIKEIIDQDLSRKISKTLTYKAI